MAVWFGLCSGWEALGAVLLAAAVHEAGHCLALWRLQTPPEKLRIGIFGGELLVDRSRLSYGGELAAVLAGPGANLLFAAVLAALEGTGWAMLIGANLVLCTFNLLPVGPLDGGRALYLVSAWAFGPSAGEKAVRWIGGMAAVFLAAALCLLMVRTGGSLWLIPPAAGLLLSAAKGMYTGP